MMFHVLHDGETPGEPSTNEVPANEVPAHDVPASDFEIGFLVGLLVGEGHFGGDGRSPQITLRMHVRHESLFSWIERRFPGGRLYGPYIHDGRHYFQWMARGAFLRDQLVPLVDRYLSAQMDGYARERFELMRARYPQRLGHAATGTSGEAIEELDDNLPIAERQQVRPLAQEPATQRSVPGDRAEADSNRLEQIFARLRKEAPGHR
jgi:hypothetical protein